MYGRLSPFAKCIADRPTYLVLVAEPVPPGDLHVELLPQDVDVVGQAQAQQLAPLRPKSSLNTSG